MLLISAAESNTRRSSSSISR